MRLTKSNSLFKVVVLGLVSLVLGGCEGVMTESQVKKEIEDAIAYANSANITVTVSPLNNLQGQVTTGSVVIAKIGYPFTVNFVVDDAYTFGGWAAYSNFTSISDTPLSDEYIEFSDEDGKGPGKSLKCSVTIKKQIENIYIVPLCGSKPAVTLTEPLSAEKDVSITTPLKVTFNKKMDLSSILKKDENGNVTGFKNFKVSYSKSTDDGESDSNGDITDYFDAQNTVLKKNGTQIVIPFKNKLDSTKWLPAASYITVELGANLSADTSEGGAVLDTTYTWTFVTGTTADVKGPAIKSYALALTNGTSEKTLESKNWSDWADFQNYRVAADYDSFKYSITADDSLTGDTGVLRYEVIQRLMYADKGAKLPNGTVLATATQFFNKNSEWNDVLGCSKNDFEVATEIDGNESGVENKVILLDELFTKYSTDGIYQITLTAVDALENYSDVPATFYFVRDTTSPCLSTNLNNISVNGGFVVSEGTVNGRYAKTGKEEITFVPKKTIVDEGLFSVNGNSLQTASKTVDWKISFSTSSTEDTHSVSSDYCNANSDTGLTFTISDLSTTQTYYPWFYFRDDLGNESAGECLLSKPVYVDATTPVVNLTCNSENVVLTEENNTLTLYTDSSQKVSISMSDSMSGISAKTLTVDGVAGSWKNELTVNPDKTYVFTVTDNAGNSITKTLYVENKTAYGIPEIYNLTVYDTSERNFETKTITAKSDDSSTKYTDYKYNIRDITNGDVTFEFYALPNSNNSEVFFEENGIAFENMTVKSYKIYSAVDNNGYYYYNYDDLLLDSENEVELADFIPIKKEQLKGFVFCHVECELDTSKFVQSKFTSYYGNNNSIDYVDPNTLNQLEFTVSNSLNSTTYNYSVALDSEGPKPIGNTGSTGVFIVSQKNEDDSYVIKGNRLPYYANLGQLYCSASDEFTFRTISAYDDTGQNNDGFVYTCFVVFDDENSAGVEYTCGNYYKTGWLNHIFDNAVFYLEDPLGNRTKIECEFTIDEEGPEINVSGVHLTKNNINYYWYKSGEGVTVTFEDNAGVKRCEYNNGGNSYFFYPDSNGNSSLILAGSSTGTTYTLKAYDTFGNLSTKTIVVGIDSTAPTCSIVNVVEYQKNLYKPGSSDVTTTYGLTYDGLQNSNTGFIEGTTSTLTVTSGFPTSLIKSAYGSYQSIIFSMTETGSGIAKIELLCGGGITNIPLSEVGKTNSSSTVRYAYSKFTGWNYSEDEHGVQTGDTESLISIRVTDMVGNICMSPIVQTLTDAKGPSLKLVGSSNTKFVQTTDDYHNYINVYTGSTSTTYSSFSATFSDDSGLNPNWTSSYLKADVNYSDSSRARFSTAFDNGSQLTSKIWGSTNGEIYQLYSQDAMGNVATYWLRVYKSAAPSGAVTTLNASQ